MKIGLSAAAFYSVMETEDQAAWLRQQKYPIDTCEMFLESFSEYSGIFGQLIRSNLGDLACDSVHPKGTQFEADLFSKVKRQSKDAHTMFMGVLEAGQSIGAHYYVWHGPFSVKSEQNPEKIYEIEKRFPVFQKEAGEHGMEILWENVSWATMHSLENIRTLKQMFPELGFVLDIKQANRMKLPWQDVLQEMGERVRHVHVLDWRKDGSLCLPGEGIVDFPALFRTLKSLHYDGVVLLEPYNDLIRSEEELRRSLTYMKECAERA